MYSFTTNIDLIGVYWRVNIDFDFGTIVGDNVKADSIILESVTLTGVYPGGSNDVSVCTPCNINVDLNFLLTDDEMYIRDIAARWLQRKWRED